ncbi:Echinoderm microtubule-associated protein-like CG42247 [Eumeta japonica]|uniref:Echinoderm microtubule-associated protein-like CG42247 n=1 Tax=Eumeta variegata TaxID=151549 RepID=A0A4C1UJ87_EUMVA|nr:Echinoderm microtubule-associated protein-like CG42247 [Eumeta japonica]
MWYGGGAVAGAGVGAGAGGWSRVGTRKQSVAESDAPPPGGGKPASGRVIRIINNMDHSIQCRVLLNLRTTQPFEEVLEDLGQVLKMSGAKRMYTISGQEVRSFSQLRNEFADVETFYLGSSLVAPAISPGVSAPLPIAESPMRRSRSRANVSSTPAAVEDMRERRARSKSRPRILYAPEGEIVRNSDYTLLEVLKEEPVRVTIRGLRRTFYPPIHHAPQDNSPPDKKMQLEWVYGYRGWDSRRNLWVLPTGELLYYVAAVAVMYDRDEHAQRHYTGHTEDIQWPARALATSSVQYSNAIGREIERYVKVESRREKESESVDVVSQFMELHPSRELVASGQRAGRGRRAQAHVRIWSTDTLQTLHVFGMAEFEAGVSAVAFSHLNGGSYVLAVDAGRESILSVWQWQWGHLLGKVATLQEELTGAAFHPLDDNLLITHGKGHLAFWNRRKDGFFERTDIIKPPARTHVTALQFEQDGDVVTADSDGFITIYSVDSDGAYFVRMEFEAHIKGISSLVMLSEGTLLSGGEKDRKIAAWDSLQNYKRITDTKVLFGHHKQLMGLAVHPDDEMFATAGHDKNVALWRGHKMVFATQVGYECVSLAWHPGGGALAVGSTEGHLVILNADAGTHVATLRVCGSPLTCLHYNSAGDILAIGSQNGSIYLFRVSRDGFSYKKSNKIRGAQPLVQLDWSLDGNYLQTVTADYDLAFWDIKALSPEKSPIAMKDVKWSTYNATVGFLVSGMWNNRFYPMTSLISSASRSAAHDLLISGDTDGYLRLFRYPCASSKAEYNEIKVYSGNVWCARFLFNDRCLVTTGGNDAALMLWELVDD